MESVQQRLRMLVDFQIQSASNSMCRGCLNTNAPELQEFFNSHLPDIYESLTSLNVSISDGLPIVICSLCQQNLENFQSFKKQCIQVHQFLMDRVKIVEIKLENEIKSINEDDNDPFSDDNHFEHLRSDNESWPSEKEEEDEDRTIVPQHESSNIEPEIKLTTFDDYAESKASNDLSSLTCDKCGKIFKRVRYLQSHMRTHFSDLRIFQCDICSKRFLKLSHLKGHIISKHTIRERRFGCEKCGKRFMNPSSLDNHMVTHSEVLPYNCTNCPKTFASKKTLNFHMKSHIQHKPFLCAICARRFNQSSHLQFHMFTHTGERPYVCKICSKAFAQPGTLKEHISLVHNAMRTKTIVNCTICSKQYNTQRSLRNHMIRHTSERRHACEICAKTFIESSKLKRHRLIHSDRRFICPICSKCLSRSDHLKAHIKKHNKNKIELV